ncbi:MAG: glucoamylase family protein [Candidatus Omnitrophica bacterium]|nr:glucoamylase family protein [Candidatus Omnitrophota bacterium]
MRKIALMLMMAFLLYSLPSGFAVETSAAEQSQGAGKDQPAGKPAMSQNEAADRAKAAAQPTEILVDDFEGEDLRNHLDGESGAWNMNPEDENNAYADIEIVDMAGKDGEKNRVLKLVYSVDSSLPASNGFWTKLRDLDAEPYDHLQFDVKGDETEGFPQLFRIELKKFKDEQRTEKIKGSFEVPVTAEWQTVSIPLNKITGIIDFGNPEIWKNPAIARKNLDEFVVVFQDRFVTKKKGAIYIDNIKFVKTGDPGPTAVDFPPRKVEKTPVRLEGLEYAQFLVKRLGGFPAKVSVKKQFPAEDRAFLMEIAKDTWRFFNEVVDQEHGLPLDTIQLGEKEPLGEGCWIGDYTNVTNIGIYLMCVVSAYDLGFITREDAVARIRKTMTTVEKLPYHKSGFPFNYYDTTTCERTSYFVSLVDSGWLVAGLYVVKNAFPEELSEQAERLLNRGNFAFFYDPVDRQMRHGYYDHLEVYSDYDYGAFYTEPRSASYIAVARGDVPEEHWFEGMIRTFPEDYTWQQQTPIDRVERTTLEFKYFGGYYEWKGIKYVPSWGGSAFEALMPTLVLKEKELASEGLGLNDLNQVLGQIHYALDELGQPVWGMSPSSDPDGGYSEFGCAPFGSKGYKAGVVTPHATALALEFAPQESIKNLRKLIELYDIYGEYGFYDAVTVKTGKVARKYLSLDQGMLFVALNNYLNNGIIRERFHSDPVMKKGDKLLSAEKFFEAPVKNAVADNPAT